MRILSVDRYLAIVGGKERYVFELASMLREQGHIVQQFAHRPPGTPRSSDVDLLPEPLDTSNQSPLHRIGVAAQRLYNLKARDALARMLDRLSLIHI